MTGTALDEGALVARAKAGDAAAFERLVLAHTPRLLALARRLGLMPADAQDVVQEALVRAWRSLGRFEERARFSTWLHRITVNEVHRHLERRPPPPHGLTVGEDELETVIDPAPLPDAVAEAGAARADLERALATVPFALRAAVVLRDVEGLSTREAAEVLGLRERALKSRLHRGRRALREALELNRGPDR